jgi:hypothetical protein
VCICKGEQAAGEEPAPEANDAAVGYGVFYDING